MCTENWIESFCKLFESFWISEWFALSVLFERGEEGYNLAKNMLGSSKDLRPILSSFFLPYWNVDVIWLIWRDILTFIDLMRGLELSLNYSALLQNVRNVLYVKSYLKGCLSFLLCSLMWWVELSQTHDCFIAEFEAHYFLVFPSIPER